MTQAAPRPMPPSLPAARPVAAGERVTSVDVLRGVAVLGIFVMNIGSFAMPEVAYSNPYAWGDMTGLNGVVFEFESIFASGKFISIFAMLFGAGIVLRGRRAVLTARLHTRRMLVLIAIGLAHAYLLWHGDILVTYGLLGLGLFALRNASARTLIRAAMFTYAVGIAINVLLAADVLAGGAEVRAELVAQFAPDAASLAREVAAFRGSWLDQLPTRASYAFQMQTVSLVLYSIPYVGGLMLFGMGLTKLGFFDGQLPRRRYAATAIGGCAIGWSINVAQLVLDASTGHDPIYGVLVWPNLNTLAMPLVAAGYAAAVQWLWQAVGNARALRPLAAVGRVALSGYLLETLVGTTLFYGHGFGWYGQIDRVHQLFVVIAVWMALLIVAPLWLRRFRFGPAEWLWRSATYGRWQPMCVV